MQQAFEQFVSHNFNLNKNTRVLLAVSGGRDSMAMLHLFNLWSAVTGVAHCNFGLRGSESDGDETFVADFCHAHHIPFFSRRFQTEAYAQTNKISIQMAARELRYNWFEELRGKEHFEYIATAHHKDDVAETILLNISRGTGLKGLQGIPAQQGSIIRPILFASRQQLDLFIRNQKISFREDASNANDYYLRNKIRHHIMPVLREMNPSIEETLAEFAELMAYHRDVYRVNLEPTRNLLLKAESDITRIEIETLRRQTSTKHLPYLLYDVLEAYNFHIDVLKELCAEEFKNIGAIYTSPTHRLLVDRKSLLLSRLNSEEKPYFTIHSFPSVIQTSHFNIRFRLLQKAPEIFKKTSLYLNFEKLALPLSLQTWQEGERFSPLGMMGSKKLSDFFIDRKATRFEKEQALVLKSNETIAALIPFTIDNNYRIEDETSQVLEIQVMPGIHE